MININQPYQKEPNNYDNFLSFIECITRIRYLADIFTFLVGIFFIYEFFYRFLLFNHRRKNNIYKFNLCFFFILFSPLWIQPFSVISNDLKDCSRIENIIILLFCLIGVVASNNQTIDKFGPLIFNFILILSGLCLSLSYFGFWKTFIRNFNKACNDCCLICDVFVVIPLDMWQLIVNVKFLNVVKIVNVVIVLISQTVMEIVLLCDWIISKNYSLFQHFCVSYFS